MKNDKKGYPNYIENFPAERPRDISKWMTAFKNIYSKIYNGLDKTSAFRQITFGWTPMEKRDFENWIKFYEGNNHQKYKTAQLSYYVNDGMPGYILPFKNDSKKEEIPKDQLEVNDFVLEEENNNQKRELIELQRSKFLSRLNSAEKLLSEEAGHLLAGEELNKFLEALHSLKREILQVNKKSIANKTYIDLIIRNANILSRDGFKKSALLFESLAQKIETAPSEEPLPTPPADLPPSTPEPINEDKKPNKLMGFLQNLDPVNKNEENSSDDGSIEVEDDSLVKEAQDVSKPLVQPTIDPPIEVSDDEKAVSSVKDQKEPANNDQDFDHLIDIAFKNLKVEDVVRKLEEISKIFKTREISRQLSIADVMLDRLGLAPFFPTLAEATNKSLESNQYCLTRIEDILSSLRGTLAGREIDLTNENNLSSDPKLELIKNKLENDKNKEKERKQLRKSVENEELMDKAKKENPEVEQVSEELNKPVQLEAPPSVPGPAQLPPSPLKK